MFKPMLAEPIETTNLEHYFTSEEWALEPKLDGHRVMVVIENGVPSFLNRKGEPFQKRLNPKVIEEFTGDMFGTGTWIFDGEYMDAERSYYMFDILETPKHKLYNAAFSRRREFLDALFATWTPFFIHLVPCLRTEHGKRDLYNRVEAAGAEGVMWKHVNAPYHPGKRSTAWLKTKLWKSADCVVTETWREGKRSVGLGLYDEDHDVIDVGSCSMSERNLARLQPGMVIEVKYLYAGAGGRLFQPAFLKVRFDKTADECFMSQLKWVNKAVIQ